MVLAGAQVAIHAVQLPAVRRRERKQAVRFALEERLATDVEQTHLTTLSWHHGTALVAAVDRQRLATIVATLSALEKPPAAAYAQLESIPHTADAWSVALLGGNLLLRRDDGAGIFLGALETAQPHALLEYALAEATRTDCAPREIRLYAEDGVRGGERRWPLPTSEVAWSPWPTDERGVSLLHGPLAAPASRANWAVSLRPALALVTLAMAIHLMATLGDLVSRRWALASALEGMKTVFLGAFPGATVVDPALQMRRQLNAARAQAGELQDLDFVALLAALSDALGAAADDCVQDLRYSDGQLEVVLQLPATLRAESLSAKLAMAGVQATPKEASAPGAWHAVLRRSEQ